MKEEKIITSQDLEILISERYCAPAWAFLPQVRNGTGILSTVRTADAIAMSLWPSRGMDLHGFEIKISRYDWQKELQNPEKAEEIAAFCDYWWIVTPDELGKSIIDRGELPTNWGLLVKRGKLLYQLKAAQKLKSIEPDRFFLASILRKVCEYKTPKALIIAANKSGYERGLKDGEAKDHEKQELNKLQKAVDLFHKKSGVHINTWSDEVGEIGEAVRAVLAGEDKKILERLTRLHTDFKKDMDKIEHYTRHTIAEIKGEKCCKDKPWI